MRGNMASVTFCWAEEKMVPLAVFVLRVGLFVGLGRKLHTGHYNWHHDIQPNDILQNRLDHARKQRMR
jgi:hypothetical protein